MPMVAMELLKYLILIQLLTYFNVSSSLIVFTSMFKNETNRANVSNLNGLYVANSPKNHLYIFSR